MTSGNRDDRPEAWTKTSKEARKSSKNFEMASSDGQHATPESHVEHAQEAAQKGRRQGDKSAKNLITSLKITRRH
jgi:hypothetical protein